MLSTSIHGEIFDFSMNIQKRRSQDVKGVSREVRTLESLLCCKKKATEETEETDFIMKGVTQGSVECHSEGIIFPL